MIERPMLLRAGTLLLALLMPVMGLRAGASTLRCAKDDCDRPCCDHDVGHATVLPVLPCCRTLALEPATPEPTPSTFESERSLLAAPALGVRAPIVFLSRAAQSSPPSPRLLPAPPLYQLHCALLL